MMSMGSGSMLIMMGVSILVIGFLLYFLIVGITKSIGEKEKGSENKAMGILKERVAQGDISTEEFQEKKNLIQNKTRGGERNDIS